LFGAHAPFFFFFVLFVCLFYFSGGTLAMFEKCCATLQSWRWHISGWMAAIVVCVLLFPYAVQTPLLRSTMTCLEGQPGEEHTYAFVTWTYITHRISIVMYLDVFFLLSFTLCFRSCRLVHYMCVIILFALSLYVMVSTFQLQHMTAQRLKDFHSQLASVNIPPSMCPPPWGVPSIKIVKSIGLVYFACGYCVFHAAIWLGMVVSYTYYLRHP
jgi:hypothetical protein